MFKYKCALLDAYPTVCVERAYSSSPNAILTQGTVFLVYNTHICKQPRRCSPSHSMMKY